MTGNRHSMSWPEPPQMPDLPTPKFDLNHEFYAMFRSVHEMRQSNWITKKCWLDDFAATSAAMYQHRNSSSSLAILGQRLSHLLNIYIDQIDHEGTLYFSNGTTLPRRSQFIRSVPQLGRNRFSKDGRCNCCGVRSEFYAEGVFGVWCRDCIASHRKVVRTWVKRWARSTTAIVVTAIVTRQREAEAEFLELQAVRALKKLLPKVRRAIQKNDRDALQSLKVELQVVGNSDL